MSKDWKGNSKATFSTLGASSHSEQDREVHDFYATSPIALELLLKLEQFENVWEPACGMLHLSDVLVKNNIHGRSSDLVNRGGNTENTNLISWQLIILKNGMAIL